MSVLGVGLSISLTALASAFKTETLSNICLRSFEQISYQFIFSYFWVLWGDPQYWKSIFVWNYKEFYWIIETSCLWNGTTDYQKPHNCVKSLTLTRSLSRSLLSFLLSPEIQTSDRHSYYSPCPIWTKCSIHSRASTWSSIIIINNSESWFFSGRVAKLFFFFSSADSDFFVLKFVKHSILHWEEIKHTN